MKAHFNRIAYQIIEEISTAENSIKIAIAWFTNENLFNSIIKALDRGIKVELITINDNINNGKLSLDFNSYIEKGGEFYFSNVSGLMHHKFALIDEKAVISGSYNWTYNAEYRNEENILISNNLQVILKFNSEFKKLKINSIIQKKKISLIPKMNLEVNETNYVKEDLFYKSIDEERKGNLNKSINLLESLEKIDSNPKITIRISEVKEKIKNPKYIYHIEDGQFSYDFEKDYLIGKEGEIVEVSTDRTDDTDYLYILFIEGNYVECIGNIERDFPKTKFEHNKIKKMILETYNY